jgi:DNA polymerase III epsilon subunit family exonuclease
MMSLPDPTIPLADVDLVFIDVETTGLYPVFGDRIVELAGLKVRDGREIDEFCELLDPRRPISPGAAAVNGITDEMLLGRPLFGEVAAAFLSFVGEAFIVAHNAPFDLGFLSVELRAAGLPQPRNQIIDTLQIARRYLRLPSHSLGFLARHFQVPAPDAHRALGDCRTTFQVFRKLMIGIFPDGEPTVGLFLDRVSGWSVPEDRTDPLMLLPPSLRGPVKRRESMIIDYIDASGNKSTRKVLLKEVAAMRDYVYLVAYCYAKQAERTFRLDRIVRWEPADK